jgi:hypothetical protein
MLPGILWSPVSIAREVLPVTTFRKFRPQFEFLGDRALPSVTLTDGLLEVVGATTDDTIRVTLASPTQVRVTDSGTGEDRTFDRSSIDRILVRSRGGDDIVVVGPNITTPAEVRAWSGNDTVLGGGGDDTILGGGGDDSLDGRGGNDDITGQAGNDHLAGGAGDDRLFGDFRQDGGVRGDDHIDGGSGRDWALGGPGSDDVSDAFDTETELAAAFAGGGAAFKFGPEDGGIEREFEVEVEGLTPNATATVQVDGVSVGTIDLDPTGSGQLKLSMSFDGNHDGVVEFPAGFPDISAGSAVVVQVNGTTAREGTFAVTTPGS